MSDSSTRRVLCFSPSNRWVVHGHWDMTIAHGLRNRGGTSVAEPDDIRRATSRVANGTAAVIWVMMKPGATALTVMPFSSSGARLSTRPITPAFEAA